MVDGLHGLLGDQPVIAHQCVSMSLFTDHRRRAVHWSCSRCAVLRLAATRGRRSRTSSSTSERTLHVPARRQAAGRARGAPVSCLPSACGGKGTCGQCKRAGAGRRRTAAADRSTARSRGAKRARTVRLACQVAVRENLNVRVPEEVFGVRKWECTRALQRQRRHLHQGAGAGAAGGRSAGVPRRRLRARSSARPSRARYSGLRRAGALPRRTGTAQSCGATRRTRRTRSSRAYSMASYPARRGMHTC